MRTAYSRRDFIKKVGCTAASLSLATCLLTGCNSQMRMVSASPQAHLNKKNILFLAIDDLRDYVNCLGGYEGKVYTPNIDKLAARGVLFTNAQCDSPACAPSRAAILSGLKPYSSGAYCNNHKLFMRSPILSQCTTLSRHFMNNGYHAAETGKIHHELWLDYIGEADNWDEVFPSKSNCSVIGGWPPIGKKLPLRKSRKGTNVWDPVDFDWGPLSCGETDMPDWKQAEWIEEWLQRKHDKPFFLAYGTHMPHVPMYVPQKYFDMYPLQEIKLPTIRKNDLDDVPEMAQKLANVGNGLNEIATVDNDWKEPIQAYLAAISFVDDCIGKIIAALDKSAYRDNTIIVFWGDNGWHLGEKTIWQKFSLWEESTRVPLIIAAPGVSRSGGKCSNPVNLSDIYPTLVELCNLPQPQQKLDGLSLRFLLENPNAKWERPALTSNSYKCYSLRFEQWRYTRYADGTEELYDHENDPKEWNNLANIAEYNEIKKRCKKWLPEKNENPLEVIPIISPSKVISG